MNGFGHLLRCPRCRQAPLSEPLRGEAVCAGCGARYPFEAGVLDLLGARAERRSLAQVAMESVQVARIYESRLWRRNPLLNLVLALGFERERAMVLGAHRPPIGGALLDVGCASGIYTRMLARLVPDGVAIGLDVSMPMLRRAARIARDSGVSNVLFVRADAGEQPFFDGRIQGANCTAALHLFPDIPRALAEIARVLEPGAVFTSAVVRQPERARPWREREIRALGLRSMTGPELLKRLAAAGFRRAEVLHARRRWLVVRAGKGGGAE